MHRDKVFVIAAIVLVVLFAVGLFQLMLLRFSTGDIYPEYSSLRSDPLGTRALFESYRDCCGLPVWRNYEPFSRIKDQSGAAVFFLGMEVPYTPLVGEEFFRELDSFIKNGGRMIVTYLPVDVQYHQWRKEQEGAEENRKEEDREKRMSRLVSFMEQWGVRYAIAEAGENAAILRSNVIREPKKLYSGSLLYFADLDSAWNVIYERAGYPVIIERKIGKGSLVLSALTHFVSNEALLREPHPELLAWLVGNKKEIIFDEYFHGVAVDPGIAALARKYGLHWVLVAVLLLGGLYVWQNAVSLIPPWEEERGRLLETARGRGSASGLTNLLRRSIPTEQIFWICFQEWKKSFSYGPRQVSRETLREVEGLAESLHSARLRPQEAVEAYNRLSELLKKRQV